MTREIEAPWKPTVGDQVTFDSPSELNKDCTKLHGYIRKVLKGTDMVHIEATSGKWYEADIEVDNVKPTRTTQRDSL
jgi:hypothetical protein